MNGGGFNNGGFNQGGFAEGIEFRCVKAKKHALGLQKCDCDKYEVSFSETAVFVSIQMSCVCR